MEVILVHPDDPGTKVPLSHPVQVAAYRGQGFVEESELVVAGSEAPATNPDVSEEVAQLKAENKALKTENTKLKNKLNAKDEGDKTDPSVTDPEGDQPKGDEEEKSK